MPIRQRTGASRSGSLEWHEVKDVDRWNFWAIGCGVDLTRTMSNPASPRPASSLKRPWT
jgi:hypothetical protein